MERFEVAGFRVQGITTKRDKRLIINTGGRDWSRLHEWIYDNYKVVSFNEVNHPDVTFLIYIIDSENTNNIGGDL